MIGLSRSGNHAIIQWIVAQARGRVCFLNAAEGGANPFWTSRVLDDGCPCRVTYPDFDYQAEARGEFARKDWLIFSHEDGWLARSCSAAFEREHDAWVGRSARRIDVLVLRDPFNLFASRLRSAEQWPFLRPGPAVARMWRQHAREFLGPPRFLRHEPVVVNFNRWALEREYRRKIAAAIGLEFTDVGREGVPPACGGSSFDARRFDGRAQQMRVMERWRHFATKTAYRALFDDELVRLSHAVFGRIAGTEAVWPRRPSRTAERTRSGSGGLLTAAAS